MNFSHLWYIIENDIITWSVSLFKLTKIEKSWIMYDVANSAFILLVTSIVPIYFNALSMEGGLTSSDYLAYWSFSASIVTIIVALLGPILGAFSDRKNMRKKFFVVSLLLGVGSGILMGFMPTWLSFLILCIIAKVSCSLTYIFTDAMLNDITTTDRMDVVSSYGYGYGYVGSCIPFIGGIVIVLFSDNLGLQQAQAVQITIIIHMIWWLLFSFPLIKNYTQHSYNLCREKHFGHGFIELKDTLKNILKDKRILLFLLAFFFYIDGVYTIISMSAAYGGSLGLDSTQLIIALLVTQIIAFPSALVFSRLTTKINPESIITFCIVAYLGIALFAIGLDTTLEFWILAVFVGLFQGTIQALSRSYFAKIIPAEDAGKYFSVMDICGKGASFLGSFSIGMVTLVTESGQLGVAALSVFFVIGLILFRLMVREGKKEKYHNVIKEQ